MHGSGRTQVRTCGTSRRQDGKNRRCRVRDQGSTQHARRAGQNTYEDEEAGPTAGRYRMRGIWLEGVNEHSPRITGVSVDDTSMNWGFSFRKSFRMASARSAWCSQVQ